MSSVCYLHSSSTTRYWMREWTFSPTPSPPTAADHHGGDLGRVTINNQDGPVSPAPDRGGALRGLCAAECAPAAPARRGHHVLIGTTAAVSVPVPRFRAVEFLSEDPVPL